MFANFVGVVKEDLKLTVQESNFTSNPSLALSLLIEFFDVSKHASRLVNCLRSVRGDSNLKFQDSPFLARTICYISLKVKLKPSESNEHWEISRPEQVIHSIQSQLSPCFKTRFQFHVHLN